MTKRTT